MNTRSGIKVYGVDNRIGKAIASFSGRGVLGKKLVIAISETIGFQVGEDYLYELLAAGTIKVLKAGKMSLLNYTFMIDPEKIYLVPTPKKRDTNAQLKVLATYPDNQGFDKIKMVSKLYPEIISLISKSKKSIKILNPYYNAGGSEKIIDAMIESSKRGVEIRIIGAIDRRYDGSWFIPSAFTDLVAQIKAGGNPENISARTFGSITNPHMGLKLHAKAICFDSELAYVGSANFTFNSLDSNLELGVLLPKEQATVVEKLFETSWRISTPI